MTEYQFTRGAQRGQWVPYRGVWQLVGVPDTERSRLWAALLRSGKHALATGPSALALYNLDVAAIAARRVGSTGQRIYLSTPANTHLRLPGLVTLREARTPQDNGLVDGVPSVSRSRALIDTVRLLGWNNSKTMVFRGVQLGWASPESFVSAAAQLAGCKGNAQLRLAGGDLTSGSHSEAERVAHRVLTRAGLDNFAADFPVYDSAGLIGYVDIAFTDSRVAIEIDGRAWHSDSTRRQRDQSRQKTSCQRRVARPAVHVGGRVAAPRPRRRHRQIRACCSHDGIDP